MSPRVLVIDHRDSFVFTLVDHFAGMGTPSHPRPTVRTVRSNLSLVQLEQQLVSFDPHLVVLSPGPGAPDQAGVMPAYLRSADHRPTLGVCLGHLSLIHI